MIGAVPALLAFSFLVTALLYASVGFGGGSTYSALLALSGLDYRLLPLVSLACNILVVLGGSIRFARAGLVPWKKALVIVALGAPASFVGGLTPIKEVTFLTLLGVSLVLTSLTMLIPVRKSVDGAPTMLARWMPIAAAPLGYLAGLVGIGGGIFLAPLLHLARWNEARGIAATASLFIFVNSLFGLAGQMLKNGPDLFGQAIGAALPLLIAVVIGGQIGSLMASRLLPPQWIRRLTALLVLVVGIRLLAGL
ncbi:MAG: sulfite exporter TauE/SafE family protein [Sphingomonadales bacterium]|nr:sulfite exporter TauE/SafE family protein [Sphingomonadales bacterium]NCQ21631.1 sulfite exporter TauE/SafE family protein [Sphingomonadales bacterium]NCT04654.1 sulfite exporter TauE/SafE family protein [Sphingomonadales bacterium]